jgi:hypothetical protein
VGYAQLLWAEDCPEERSRLCDCHGVVPGQPRHVGHLCRRVAAQQICEKKGLDFSTITYIECNPNTNSKLSFYDEEYFEVTFTDGEAPKYRQLPAEEIKSILE